MIAWSLAAVAGLLLVDRAAVLTMRPPSRGPLRRAADLGLDAEPLEFDSSGCTLRGELIRPRRAVRSSADGADRGGDETEDLRPVAVLVHGWTGTAGFMLQLAKPLVEAGYPTIVFDIRSHGRSDRAPAVTIRHFRDDLMRAVALAAELEPGRPRVVVGHSLGGGAAVLACAQGMNVDGLVLVAAPADLFEVTARFYSDHRLPGRMLTRLFTPSWRLRAAESFRNLNPETAAARVTARVAIVQGAEDTRVPPEQAHRLARGLGIEPLLLPGVGHRDILGRPELHEAVIRFLDERSA